MFEKIKESTFLVTGGAGFIGCNLARYLLLNGAQKVVVLDNLSTGHPGNIEDLKKFPQFKFIKGNICERESCLMAMEGIDYVFHEAALGSVPRSIIDPMSTVETNISGFLQVLIAAKQQKVKRVVYASSSSTYGDNTDMPKVEKIIGKPLSPYAVTKYVDELFADVFGKTYGMDIVGLRYFNVFGPFQNKTGAYAAVIPLFLDSVLEKKQVIINGDGKQSRDFTFVDNVIQANIRAVFYNKRNEQHEVYNVACGESINLNKLWQLCCKLGGSKIDPIYGPERIGDIRDSLADIEKAKRELGYKPIITLTKGLEITYEWYKSKLS